MLQYTDLMSNIDALYAHMLKAKMYFASAEKAILNDAQLSERERGHYAYELRDLMFRMSATIQGISTRHRDWESLVESRKESEYDKAM